MHSEPAGLIQRILFDGIQLHQMLNSQAEQGLYDVRPPCNPQSPTGMGMDNAWCLNPHSGRAWGVEPYPGGLPVLYANGVTDLTLREFDYQRPTPLPARWNHNALCLENTDK